MLQRWKTVIINAAQDVDKNHTMAFAAALSYYFLLSIFPALIAMASVLGFLPIPNLWEKALWLMSQYVPPDSMGLVREVLQDVITPNKGALLSVGILGTLWASSSGFAAMIEALNVAYDVPETRPIWKTRPLAIALTLGVGSLVIVGLLVMLVGPAFGGWLAGKLHLSGVYATVWPYVRWAVSTLCIVLAIEALYFLAPNVKQRFKCSLPGAIFAVSSWLLLSYLLGIYFQKFANFNKTYGALGAAVALMTWFYWTAFAILLGAEINSELLQVSGDGKLPLKQAPPKAVRPKKATEADLAA